MDEVNYTGIRTRFNLRMNCFIIMDTQDTASAIRDARLQLREWALRQCEDGLPAGLSDAIDSVEPWRVKVVPASWGYPPRVVVTF